MTVRRRVLVTGAGSGIGRATCVRLLAGGTRVAAVDVDAESLGRLDADVASSDLVTVESDVTDPDAVAAAVASVVTKLDGLDGVVTCAGGGTFSGDIAATPIDHWRRTIELNLTGTFLVCRAALAALRAAGGGSIVTISSTYGVTGLTDDPSYAAAKAGVIGLTKAMALDLGPDGIRVNCIAPGTIATPAMAESRRGTAAGGPGGREAERIAHRMVLGPVGQADQVAAAVEFLLSDGAANITGVVLPVDAGWLAG